MYTLEECEKLWDEAGKHGAAPERMARTRRWFPYYSYLAGTMKNAPYSLPEQPRPFVDILRRENILRDTDTLLDIGAGMGGFSLEASRYCRSVAALEPNGDCLELLRRRAELCGVENVTPVEGFWETYSPEEAFDVTFSAMCPAICNVEELQKMEAMTKRTCCLVAVTRGSYEKHRKAMMQELGIRPQGGMTTEAIHYINALYLLGRQVNIHCVTTRASYPVPETRILEQYPIYFQIFGIPEEISVKFLKDYLERNAVGGFLEDEVLLNQALIYWDVPEKK